MSSASSRILPSLRGRLLAKCGQVDVTNGVMAMYLSVIQEMPQEVLQEWDVHAQALFGLSIEEVKQLYTFKYTFEMYHAFKNITKHKSFPDHPLDFLLPITLKSMASQWCLALVDEARESDIDDKVRGFF